MPSPSSFSPDALAGQHVLISGGAGAIGVGVVKALTEHGAVMTINDVIEPEQARDRFEAAGIDPARIAYVPGDLTQPSVVAGYIEAAQTRFGIFHTALCHAGMVLSAPILDYTPDDWDRLMQLNLKAAFLLAQAAARAMIGADVAGLLLFTSSWVAETPWPEIGIYNTSKAGMNQMMRSFARELAPQHIRANCIAPGIVGVGMAKRQWDTEPSYRARAEKAIPLGFMQPLESVADSFVFACSPAARYMTGTVLLVDGGCSLYPMD